MRSCRHAEKAAFDCGECPAVQQREMLASRLGDGIVQIRLPMAGSPLRHINAYVFDDEDGCTLVDCGWKADDVLGALHAGLESAGRKLHDVTRLLVTHQHFDHYGLAGTLMRAGVAKLHMHRVDWNVAQSILRDPATFERECDDWLAHNGLRVENALGEDLLHLRTELAEPTHFIEDGARIGRLRAVWTPGHSPGHVCFVDARSGRMLTGDHILDPVTPHVGVWRDRGEDPLGDYQASLNKVASLGATGVLPAHGEPFPDLRRRAAELLAHEAAREAHVLGVLERGAAHAATVARALPWTRRNLPFADLSPAHRQFAVAETIAHLEHLRARRVVTRTFVAATYEYAR